MKIVMNNLVVLSPSTIKAKIAVPSQISTIDYCLIAAINRNLSLF